MRALWTRDWAVAALGLLAILVWELGAWDISVVRWFGSAQGFALREAWWTRAVLHDGGRMLSFVLLGLMLLDAIRPLRPGPARTLRWYWVGATLVSVILVQVMKRSSNTSCPWSLAEFGGAAQYVAHWQWGGLDGGPGHCFPAGHASAAFVFLSLYFLWREHDARLARGLLSGVLVAGVAFSATQLVRGAHYPSHMLWSAWLCWMVCTLAAHTQRRLGMSLTPQTL